MAVLAQKSQNNLFVADIFVTQSTQVDDPLVLSLKSTLI